MVTSSSSPAPRRPVVRSLASAVDRPCARPGCPAPARATLTFSYASREAVLDRLADVEQPQGYDLCGPHAGRTEPPRGWALDDRRPPEDVAPPPPRRDDRDLGGEATVAVLAAALRAVPDPVPPPAPQVPAADASEPPAPVPHGDVHVEPTPTEPPPPPPAASASVGEDTVELAIADAERWSAASDAAADGTAADDVDTGPPPSPFEVPAARDRRR